MIALSACGSSSEPSGKDICDKAQKLCPSSMGGSGGGTSTSVTFTCDPSEADSISNKQEVSDCMDKATDCNGAVACMLTAKK
jgi:hypothetical protein